VDQAQNDLLTQVGPGTPGGEMLRRYWTPAALSEELPIGGAPLPIRLLGEDLVLFRDDQGQPGLLGLHCAHRGADLSYGRTEDGGLRCLYHGWLYDRQGRCLEQPGEPAGSSFHEKIRQRAYPCHETAGVIFTYMGPPEIPLFPNYALFRVPPEQQWVHKHYHECSYLQGDEGNIDSVHVSILHAFLPGGRYARGPNPQGGSGDGVARGARAVYSTVPKCEFTHFGVRIYQMNDSDAPYVQTKNFVMPWTCAVGGGPSGTGDGYLMNWHIPIDDTHHWRYSMSFKLSGPIDPKHVIARESVTDEHYRFFRKRENRYLQDREEMKTDTFAGFGPVFVTGDHFATETAGAIQDRTQEHLAPSDAGLVAVRQALRGAIKDVQAGRDPPNVIRTPEQQERLLDITVARFGLPSVAAWDDFPPKVSQSEA